MNMIINQQEVKPKIIKLLHCSQVFDLHVPCQYNEYVRFYLEVVEFTRAPIMSQKARVKNLPDGCSATFILFCRSSDCRF